MALFFIRFTSTNWDLVLFNNQMSIAFFFYFFFSGFTNSAVFILRVAVGSFYAISVIPFRFIFCTAAKQCTCFHILYDFTPALAAYWTPFYFVSIIIAFHYITASMNSNLSNCSTYWYLIIFLLQL